MTAVNEPYEKELVIRVPKGAVSKSRKHSVLKFNNCTDNVDITQSSSLQFCREDNEATYVVQNDKGPMSGVGSEFGRHLREEARRKKMGFSSAKYSKDSQPWIATVNPDTKQSKKYRGIKEGGVSQNADFWIFVKSSDGSLEAFPVDEWYNFMPIARYKTLDSEEAEEKFSQRNKILNQFALKIREQLQVVDRSGEASVASNKPKDDDDDDDPSKAKKKKEKVEKEARPSKRTNKSKKKPKMKKPKVEKDEDFVASDDSDDGDEEGREVDYMSDSEISVSSEEGPEEEKVRQQLIGVDEEDGMKKMIASDDEEEDEEVAEDEDNGAGGKVKKFEQVAKLESLPTAGVDNDGDDTDSGSESEDPDEDVKSPFFMQDKKSVVERANEGEADESANASKTNSTSSKRKLNDDNGTPTSSKKIKTEKEKSPEANGITEDEVRRYLQKKPQSSKELVAKFKPKCQDMSKAEVVKLLADILKSLGPEQIEKNGVMYFTLRK